MYARDGELIDISDSGAAIRAQFPQSSGEFLAFVLRWNEESILLRGRVVRTAVHRTMPMTDSGMPKIEHHIAVEFVGLPPHSVDQLKRLTATVH
ncbi:MAG: PilZ domain-containing protein [Acidimicrobiia bacterium]|nr:PilZ domain-containing protein [Acidimicrobiia bacterium]